MRLVAIYTFGDPLEGSTAVESAVQFTNCITLWRLALDFVQDLELPDKQAEELFNEILAAGRRIDPTIWVRRAVAVAKENWENNERDAPATFVITGFLNPKEADLMASMFSAPVYHMDHTQADFAKRVQEVIEHG